jgi:hypothetical protein
MAEAYNQNERVRRVKTQETEVSKAELTIRELNAKIRAKRYEMEHEIELLEIELQRAKLTLTFEQAYLSEARADLESGGVT